MELKNGETYNGNLISCDNFMNILLRDVICTSRVRIILFVCRNKKIEFILFCRMVIAFGKFLNVTYVVTR